MQHRLGHRNLQGQDVALRHVDRDLPHPTAQTAARSQHGSPRHAIAAGDEQGVAHRALVGKRRAPAQQRAHGLLFQNGVLRVGFLHALLTEAYVENLQLADILLVLLEEERQLGILQRQRQRGTYNVGADVIRIVLGHQARGHVDAHHLGLRGIDILHQRGKAAGQRLVEARAK